MDFESLLPIVLGIIYLVSRFLKEKKKQQKQRPARPQSQQQGNQSLPQQSQAPKKKQFSFEEILKDFEKNLAGGELEEEKPLPVEEMEYEKAQPTQRTPDKKRSKYETFEGTSYETPEVLAQNRAEDDSFARNDNYRVKGEEEENEFISLLRQPDGAKKAIVLSEILNRKHF